MMASTTAIAAACRVPISPGMRYAVHDSASTKGTHFSAVSWLLSGLASPLITRRDERQQDDDADDGDHPVQRARLRARGVEEDGRLGLHRCTARRRDRLVKIKPIGRVRITKPAAIRKKMGNSSEMLNSSMLRIV